MRELEARGLFGLLMIGLACWVAFGEHGAAADPPAQELTAYDVTCPPPNAKGSSGSFIVQKVNCVSPDGGGIGYRAVRAENSVTGATDIYFCPVLGCDRTNYTVRGMRRGPTANGGVSYGGDFVANQFQCIAASTTDAGQKIAVHCATR